MLSNDIKKVRASSPWAFWGNWQNTWKNCDFFEKLRKKISSYFYIKYGVFLGRITQKSCLKRHLLPQSLMKFEKKSKNINLKNVDYDVLGMEIQHFKVLKSKSIILNRSIYAIKLCGCPKRCKMLCNGEQRIKFIVNFNYFCIM